MEVFNNNFLKINYDAANKICIGEWTNATEHANAEDFKQWNNELVQRIEQNKSTGFLGNTLNYKFIISPELQAWSSKNIFEKFAKAGITKMALIVTDGIFQQISLEQLVDEYEEGNIETKYFTNIDNAQQWLTE